MMNTNKNENIVTINTISNVSIGEISLDCFGEELSCHHYEAMWIPTSWNYCPVCQAKIIRNNIESSVATSTNDKCLHETGISKTGEQWKYCPKCGEKL